MICSNCGQPATYVDDRPGANAVAWCQQDLPRALWPMRDSLVPQQAPTPAGADVQPTDAGTPTPVEDSGLRVGADDDEGDEGDGDEPRRARRGRPPRRTE